MKICLLAIVSLQLLYKLRALMPGLIELVLKHMETLGVELTLRLSVSHAVTAMTAAV